MVRLYVKDSIDGTIHEYGTNPHDSLLLNKDGSIHYQNIQNSTGTCCPKEGYRFCLKDGTIPDDTEEPFEAILDIGGEHQEKLNFHNCLRLIGECVNAKVVSLDPENSNNVLVYRSAGEFVPEGWYSENAHTVAQELMEDVEGQQILLNALKEKGVEFKAMPLIFF